MTSAGPAGHEYWKWLSGGALAVEYDSDSREQNT